MSTQAELTGDVPVEPGMPGKSPRTRSIGQLVVRAILDANSANEDDVLRESFGRLLENDEAETTYETVDQADRAIDQMDDGDYAIIRIVKRVRKATQMVPKTTITSL